MRARRVAPLKAMIESAFAEHGRVEIIDIGGNERYWNILGRDYLGSHAVQLTIVNPASFELATNHDRFTFRIGDGCDLSDIPSRVFHIAHSNSVIEHVGDWERMKRFAAEMRRVSERQFVQTPNFWFPMEPHCMTPLFHWLPKPLRVWLVRHCQLGHWPRAATVDEAVSLVESARLLNKPMMRELFADCTIVTERIMLLPKSIIAFTH